MKSEVFIKTENKGDLLNHRLNHYFMIEYYAKSPNDTSDTELFRVYSDVYAYDNLAEKAATWGTVITKIQAHALGKQLRPDGELLDDLTGEVLNLSIVDVAEAMELRIMELSVKTVELIEQGFTYDSIKFGASLLDQANWTFLLAKRDQLTYPVADMAKDWDGAYYTISDAASLDALTDAGLVHVNMYRSSHKILKDSILGCTTVEEINAIVDNRT